uniref:C2H2-type domain-containing protein n=1 Tax=Salmo trutta TaxID=8032 RepID=A0A674DN92_SALTR
MLLLILDGTTAYIHHTPKGILTSNLGQIHCHLVFFGPVPHTSVKGYDPNAVEAVQLDDGSAAYIHHPLGLQVGSTILTLQPGGALAELAADDTVDVDTITTLENYAKVALFQSVLSLSHFTCPCFQTSEETFGCDYEGFGRLYTTAHHLKVHERAHTDVRPYRCDVLTCGKAFTTGYRVKSHLRTHTGEKPYQCPEDICFKAFKTSRDLQKHVRTHTGSRTHTHTKPFKYPFEGCGRSFTTSNIRKVHIRTHTGERPYMCPEPSCGRSFASATNYKNNTRIHTGRTHPKIKQYSSLYKHHVVHTHCKPYTCIHCGKTYRQPSILAMHRDFEATGDRGEDGSDSQDVIGSQVGLSEKDLQALGTAITMVMRDGTTISLPTQQTDMLAMGHRHITMVTGEGKELQQVGYTRLAGLWPYQQVVLLATDNGTPIAFQVSSCTQRLRTCRVALLALYCVCGWRSSRHRRRPSAWRQLPSSREGWFGTRTPQRGAAETHLPPHLPPRPWVRHGARSNQLQSTPGAQPPATNTVCGSQN